MHPEGCLWLPLHFPSYVCKYYTWHLNTTYITRTEPCDLLLCIDLPNTDVRYAGSVSISVANSWERQGKNAKVAE